MLYHILVWEFYISKTHFQHRYEYWEQRQKTTINVFKHWKRHWDPDTNKSQGGECGIHHLAPCGTCNHWMRQGSIDCNQNLLVNLLWIAYIHVGHTIGSCSHPLNYHPLPIPEWHDFEWLIELAEDGPNLEKWVVSDLCVVNQMNWGHYFVKAISPLCIWNAFIVYITVKWPLHVSSSSELYPDVIRIP